jgi:dihydropteroate synthase
MAVDPGIGFGKTVEHNVALLVGVPELRKATGRPLVIGISRKSFLGKLLELPKAEDRLAASLGGLAFAAMRGAEIFRVHDVKESCDIVRLLAIFREAEERTCNG